MSVVAQRSCSETGVSSIERVVISIYEPEHIHLNCSRETVMIDTATVQWLFPSGLVAGIFGWGLKEYIAHLRRRDVAHTRSEAEHAKQLDSVVKNLTRITDVLTGFEGHGGLLERVDTIDANADAALIRVTQLEKKVAYLEIVSGYRDTYITRLGRMLNVEFVPPEPRKE